MSVSDLEQEYDLVALRFLELASKEMQKVTHGNARAKLAAMWEGPLSFMYGSIQTLLSGVVLVHRSALTSIFKFLERDFKFGPTPQKFPHGCRSFIFDPHNLRRFDADFNWRGRAYSSSGAPALESGCAMKMNNGPILAFLIQFASRSVKSKSAIAWTHLRQALKFVPNSAGGVAVRACHQNCKK